MSLEIKSCVLYSWDFLTELVWGLPVSLRSQEKYQSNNFRGCFSIKPYWNKTQMSNSLFSTHTFYFENLFFAKPCSENSLVGYHCFTVTTKLSQIID